MSAPTPDEAAARPGIECKPDPADIRHADVVQRALKMQEGTVLAREVMRLRGGQCTALCSDMEQDRDALLAERHALRAELEQALTQVAAVRPVLDAAEAVTNGWANDAWDVNQEASDDLGALDSALVDYRAALGATGEAPTPSEPQAGAELGIGSGPALPSPVAEGTTEPAQSEDARLTAIARLLNWGDSVGGEAGGRRDVIECRNAIAVDLRQLGVTGAEMSAAIRAGFRREHVRRIAALAGSAGTEEHGRG